MVGVRRGLVACVVGLVVLLAVLPVTGWARRPGWSALVLRRRAGRGDRAPGGRRRGRRVRAGRPGHADPGHPRLRRRGRWSPSRWRRREVADCAGAADASSRSPWTSWTAGSRGVRARRPRSAPGSTGRPTRSSSSCSACTSPARPARGCWRWGWSATRTPSPPGCCRGCGGELPPRYWRKVVAAFTGIALLVAASGCAPRRGDVRRAGGRRACSWPSPSAGTWCGCGDDGRPGEPDGPRRRTPRQHPRAEQVMDMRVLAAVSVLVSAAVHLYLWLDFARDDDFLGPSFMLNAVAGAVIAVLLLVWRHWLPAVPGGGLRPLHAARLRAGHDGRPLRRHRELDRVGRVGRGRRPRSSRRWRAPGCWPRTTRCAVRLRGSRVQS